MKITKTMFKTSSTYSSSQKCEQKYELDDLRAYPYAQESITASLIYARAVRPPTWANILN